MIKKFPHYKQTDFKDCGPTCLKIIAKYYKKTIAIQTLRVINETTRSGSSLLGLSEASEKINNTEYDHTTACQYNPHSNTWKNEDV